MGEIVRCARALVDGRQIEDFAFAVVGEKIARTGAFEDLQNDWPGSPVRAFGRDVLVVPGFVNGHSHAYQILLRGWADDLPFARWRSEALYKVVPQLTPDDIYHTFRVAFDEMLAAGITTVAEFFYLNGAGNAHAERAIEAAADAGIRLVFARTWMDAAYAPAAFRETIDAAAKRTQQLRTQFPGVHVCVAPHSLHACSPQMLRIAAEFAAAHGCMMHVHVAEAAYEGEQTRESSGLSPIALLQSLDALNERTVAIHAIYVDDDEKRLLAQRGARVVHNPMTNQYLGDGICDITGLQSLGVAMGLGTDADLKPSLFEEMRAACLLQKIAHLDGSAMPASVAFDLGTAQGARALNVDAGALRAGAFADYAVIDAEPIDAWSPPLNALVYRAENSWVRQTFVGGRPVWGRGDTTVQPARAAMARRMQSL